MIRALTLPGGPVASLAVFVLVVAGCDGCGEAAVDRLERHVTDDPDRPGKVGTLRALEVASTARDVAGRQLYRRQEGCDIGWRLDEPFDVEFELSLDVEHPRRNTNWRETGRWRRDGDGRWLLEADIAFESGSTEGGRNWQVFAGERRLWEWLGPQVAAIYERDDVVERYWRREFSTRFSTLMRLAADGWQPTDEARRWGPGAQQIRCPPAGAREDTASWASILKQRASMREASMTGPSSQRASEQRRCRRLEARYRLDAGGQMQLDYRECNLGDPPDRLQRPAVERTVRIGRDRHRYRLESQLRRWLEQGMVEPAEHDP